MNNYFQGKGISLGQFVKGGENNNNNSKLYYLHLLNDRRQDIDDTQINSKLFKIQIKLNSIPPWQISIVVRNMTNE